MPIVPLRSGQNYAPAAPLTRLQSRGAPRQHYVCDALKERFQHYLNLERSVWSDMISAGEKINQIVQGNHLVERNPWTGGWLIIQPARDDAATRRSLNLTQFYVTNCLQKWGASRPNTTARPGADDDRLELVARGADTVVNYFERKFYQPWFNYQEGLHALTFGSYIERLRYDAGAKGAVGLREVVENREISLGDGAGYCGECSYSGPASHFSGQACPACGSPSVMVEPPATDTLPMVTGQERVETGDLVLDLLPFAACRWDLRYRAEESDWFLFQQAAPAGALRRLLGDVRLPGEPETDQGLELVRRLGYAGQAIEGSSANSRRNKKESVADEVTICEMWLSPDLYADIQLKGDEMTVSGESLPAGNLVDLFPDGLVAVGTNRMTTVLGLYAEKHRDSIASGTWHMRLMSGAGRGIGDVVEVQKRLNKLDSQQLAFMDAAATPATLIDKGVISQDEGAYLGTPRANIYVDLAQNPNFTRLADAVHQLPPASVPGQMVQYVQQFLTQAFATTSHATDFTNGGLFNVRNDTARGASIADANANSLFGPMLEVKAAVRRSIAERIVKYYQAYFPVARYFPLGGANGQEQGVWLAGADLRGDIFFETAENSELPENSVTRQDRVMQFYVGLFGGFPNYMAARMSSPLEVATLARIFNVESTASEFDVVSQNCRRRLEQLKKLVGLGDPGVMVLSLQPAVSMFEKNQDQKALWFQNWLDTDEGLSAPLELRGAVELMIQSHFEMAGLQQAAIAGQGAQVAAIAGQGEDTGSNG